MTERSRVEKKNSRTQVKGREAEEESLKLGYIRITIYLFKALASNQLRLFT